MAEVTRLDPKWGRKLIVFLAIGCLAFGADASSVTIDSVAQRWPWNNKVDITYTIAGGQTLTPDGSGDVYCRLVFHANIGGQTYEIDGVTNIGASASTGQHTVTWTPPADLRVKALDCTMTATLLSADNPSGDDYLIIDLNTGNIAYEGLLGSQELSNSRYNTATFKTDKIVLRKIPKGTYPTGASNEANNLPRTWTTDLDYYIGVFMVTQAQYVKLGLSNPCVNATGQTTDSENAATDGDWAAHRPVTRVSWDTLRGSTLMPTNELPTVDSANTGTWLQRLNYLTGNRFMFDLPTEVMAEIAVRAGSTTRYWWGADWDDNMVVFSGNSTNTKAVGLFPANGFGLYDVAGNAFDFCLDSRILPPVHVDPWTPDSDDTTAYMMLRGGSYSQNAGDYRFWASNRGGYTSRSYGSSNGIGFRVAWIVR